MIHYTCKHEFIDEAGNKTVNRTYWDSQEELKDYLFEEFSEFYVQNDDRELMKLKDLHLKYYLEAGSWITLFFTNDVVFIYPSEDEEKCLR